MPQYCFVCPKCAHKETFLRTIANRNETTICERCLRAAGPGTPPFPLDDIVMRRDIHSETVWSDNTEYAQPVFSDSMGVHPKQVAKAQAMHPHIKYQPDGRIRIDSPREYKEVRKALGMVDLRKK